MRMSLRKIIIEVVKEVVGEVKFGKIRVELFADHSKQERTKKMGTYDITPIISADNPKIKQIFSEDEIKNFNLYFGDDYQRFICSEGILEYEYDDSSDYDGANISVSLDIDTLNDNDWNLIKSRVKPILEQSDLDDAIKKIGNLKRSLKQYKGDNKTFKQQVSDIEAKLYGYLEDNFILKFNNGKFGLYSFVGQRLRNIIPPLFNYILPEYKDDKYRTFEVVKGEYVFIIKMERGKINVLEKYPISSFMEEYKEYLIDSYKDENLSQEELEGLEKEIKHIVKSAKWGGGEKKLPKNKVIRSHWEEGGEELIKNITDSIKKTYY